MDINWIWDSAIAYLGLHLPNLIPYISPFWYWVFWAAVVSAICVLVGWGFSILRPIAATVILICIAGLTGYRRGQYDQYHHDQGDDK